MLLADHVYRDEGSGKYVIAGTFHRLNVAGFPTTLAKTVGVFVSLSGCDGDIDLDMDFIDGQTGDVLLSSQSLAFHCNDPTLPVDFALELPPLPLPRSGRYALRLAANGTVLGEIPVIAEGADSMSQMSGALAAAAGMTVEEYDPALVVDAVNALQALGKDAALAHVDELIAERGQDPRGTVGLFWVLRVLFDVPDTPGHPPVQIGAPTIPPPSRAASLPRFPIVVANDIPLLGLRGFFLGGLAEPVAAHAEHYRAHGTIRAAPLSPSPEGAMDEFLRQWKAAYGESYPAEGPQVAEEQLARMMRAGG
jgi:hypothetical protein